VIDRCTFRPPSPSDGREMWRLARESGVLDVNSAYCYIMLARYFADTCALAEREGRVVGFVTAFRPPVREDTLFIWQIAVDRAERGRGVGSRLLREVLDRPRSQGIRYIEATVTPGNQASRALLGRLARGCGTELSETAGFPGTLFPGPAHEDEQLLRIGPLDGTGTVR